MKYSLQQLGMCVRSATEADHGLIYDSMINSLHKGNPQNKCVRMGLFKQYIRRILDDCLGHVTLCIVCSTTDANVIHGWAAMDGDRLIYLYVPLLWRNKGIASAMLDLLQPRSYVFWTFHFRDIAKARDLAFIPETMQPLTK